MIFELTNNSRSSLYLNRLNKKKNTIEVHQGALLITVTVKIGDIWYRSHVINLYRTNYLLALTVLLTVAWHLRGHAVIIAKTR